ncbi:p53-induced death domain-containing protein 1 isoform X3 [Scleropages formosus]|uniref:p53-induced death domain-containing protein 1 isoform X3 n=1 Tax=Scleropages formosus TaxID=113540 RepID=UPI00087819EF|nr:p53-induced death domain-containing protein 1 isoform X3 [Scleropages formosus]
MDQFCTEMESLHMDHVTECSLEQTGEQHSIKKPQCMRTENGECLLKQRAVNGGADIRCIERHETAVDGKSQRDYSERVVALGEPVQKPLSVSPFLVPVQNPISLISSSPTPSHYLFPAPCLSFPCSLFPFSSLQSSFNFSTMLVDSRLTLDVYSGGSYVLEILWKTVPGKLKEVLYLRMGSEDEEGLRRALDVLGHLSLLRSLAIRGHCLQDSLGNPLPGLLSSLPPSLSSLTQLTHLDLSFNRFTSLPPCLLSMPLLSILILSHNCLSSLPPKFGSLRSLTYFSAMGNQLCSLPPSLGQLEVLQTLDVSYNILESLPVETGALLRLQKLELSHNKLRELPETLNSLVDLRELLVNSNNLRTVPEFLSCLPELRRLDVGNNPIGRPTTPPPTLPAPVQTEADLPELHLAADQHCFFVSPAGCHVFLPRGAELLFPQRCVDAITQLEWAEKKPDRKWVWLEEHDYLLSWPLELRPHGVLFQKPVQVCIPYRRSSRREVFLRTFDDQSWKTLDTQTKRGSPKNSVRPKGRPAWLACCLVNHFSWFVAVSRPVRDSCFVSPEGTLLVSSVDPGIKLTFLPCCTLETRIVTLQSPNLPFLQPVKVQVPLPPGLTGHTLDRSCLYLLHADPTCHTWMDITLQSSLHVTHLYAVFTITHFSWYWLWYTTQRCVSGVIRKVYQRLRQFHVQFLVLQRKADPQQVLLQCLPSNKVEKTVQCLSAQYYGPQPSDLCELLEGEQFFAGFEKGIDICTDRPDCVDGKLCFVFYSHLKNHKEVYICHNKREQESVRGQVSFYRGELPKDTPQEVVQKRKGPDSQWLTTLPLMLPGVKSDVGDMGTPQYPPLQLGDPENGYLTEANLLAISLRIGQDWLPIGINLGFSYEELDRIRYKHRDNLSALVLEILFHWARTRGEAGPGAIPELVKAMAVSGRRDLADEIEDIVHLGTRKYKLSLRRVGLNTEGLPAD